MCWVQNVGRKIFLAPSPCLRCVYVRELAVVVRKLRVQIRWMSTVSMDVCCTSWWLTHRSSFLPYKLPMNQPSNHATFSGNVAQYRTTATIHAIASQPSKRKVSKGDQSGRLAAGVSSALPTEGVKTSRGASYVAVGVVIVTSVVGAPPSMTLGVGQWMFLLVG